MRKSKFTPETIEAVQNAIRMGMGPAKIRNLFSIPESTIWYYKQMLDPLTKENIRENHRRFLKNNAGYQKKWRLSNVQKEKARIAAMRQKLIHSGKLDSKLVAAILKE